MIAGWKVRARALNTEIHALALACQDPRTPWSARLVLLLVVGYAFSPIDLIPDFIPVLGYLDDLLLLPLGVALALRLVPVAVMADARARARAGAANDSRSRIAAAVVILIWIGFLMLAARWAARWWYG